MPASKAGEYHLDPRAVGLHLAAGGVVLGPGPSDLFRLARKIEIGAGPSGNRQRRIPKRIPLFALDDFRRQRDLQFVEWLDLLLGQAADAAGESRTRVLGCVQARSNFRCSFLTASSCTTGWPARMVKDARN